MAPLRQQGIDVCVEAFARRTVRAMKHAAVVRPIAYDALESGTSWPSKLSQALRRSSPRFGTANDNRLDGATPAAHFECSNTGNAPRTAVTNPE